MEIGNQILRTKLTFVASIAGSNSHLEETLDKEGWVEFSTSKSHSLKFAKKEVQRKLDSAKSIEDFRFRFKKIPTNTSNSIEEYLQLLTISKKFNLLVDKFLARYLGYSQLLVGNKLDDNVAVYITSSKSFITYLSIVFGRPSMRKLIRMSKLRVMIEDNKNLIGNYCPSTVNLSHSMIIRPYVVTAGKNGNRLFNSEPSMPAISKRLGLNSYGIVKNRIVARIPHFEEVKLDKAHYPFSRKEDLFFHALHWTLPKVMMAIDQMRNENDSTLLINENLNGTVRDVVIDYANSQMLHDRIRFVDYETSLKIKSLNLYSAEYQNDSGAFVYLDKAQFIKIIESVFPVENSQSFSRQSKNVLLLRDRYSRNTADRGIRNWIEIQELLLTNNFIMVDLANLTLLEQIQLYKEAECIIGLHGGHFSQMFSAREFTNIVEIFSGLHSRCFQDMASQYGLRYRSIRAEKQRGEWYLDPSKVLRIIESALL